MTRLALALAAVMHRWRTIVAFGVGALVLVAIVVVSGVLPINASSGHWRLTSAFLDFAKVRSVSTHSWGLRGPALEDDGLILKGAGHYETACLPCHGAPGRPIPPVVAAMTPPPPVLNQQVARWEPGELFWIVKHGIKFTGMPGWPTQQRDDEVWAMTAFLRQLPALDAAGYRQLVFGTVAADPAAPAPVRDQCGRCHGADGTGRGPGTIPSLAGQRSAYLYGTLQAFRAGSRFSGMMSEVAARLDDDAMREIAAYYEGLPSRAPDAGAGEAVIERGRMVATRGIPARDVPACVECHGPSQLPKNAAYPMLTSQHRRYLVTQLMLLQQRQRGGTLNVNLMHAFVDRLQPGDIQDIAGYYASLPR